MSKVHITQFEDDGNSLIEKAREVCKQFNASDNEEEKEDLLLKLFNKIGERFVVVQPLTVDTGNVAIDNVGLSMGVTLITNNHPCNPLTLDKWVDIKKPIVIEDDVWIGANSIIMGNVTIGKGAMIGAGSVVAKSIPAGEVWAGNPARFIETVEEFKSKHKV